MTFSPNSTSSMSRKGASFTGPSAIEVLGDRARDCNDLAFSQAGKDRQREYMPGEPFGHGKVSFVVVEPLVRRRQMEGLRVVPPRSDTARGEVFCKAGRVRRLDYVDVPRRFAAVGHRRAGDVANS